MNHSRQRAVLAVLGAFAVALAVAGPGAGQTTPAGAEGHQVYFGWLLGTTSIAAVALDVGAPDDAGAKTVRVYVCDGLGLPAGMAVWFKGVVNGEHVDDVTLASPGGHESLFIDHLDAASVTGAFTGLDGQPYRFVASRAIDGAGIYDVTLDEGLRYRGTSTDGSKLVAEADQDGRVRGTITTADGRDIAFSVRTLSLVPAAELDARGLPTDYRQFAENSLVPDSYVAVISPGGAFWLGRSGAVRDGDPGGNVIGLDMNC